MSFSKLEWCLVGGWWLKSAPSSPSTRISGWRRLLAMPWASSCSRPPDFVKTTSRSEDCPWVAFLVRWICIELTYVFHFFQLFFTILEKSDIEEIRGNSVLYCRDLMIQYPNMLAPWTPYIYRRCISLCPCFCFFFLNFHVNHWFWFLFEDYMTHLTWWRSRHWESWMNWCSVTWLKSEVKFQMLPSVSWTLILVSQVSSNLDPLTFIFRHMFNFSIVWNFFIWTDAARLFFVELAGKGNSVYNVLPDIISRLSDAEVGTSEEHFQNILKWDSVAYF